MATPEQFLAGSREGPALYAAGADAISSNDNAEVTVCRSQMPRP
jgi:hypothetical protein